MGRPLRPCPMPNRPSKNSVLWNPPAFVAEVSATWPLVVSMLEPTGIDAADRRTRNLLVPFVRTSTLPLIGAASTVLARTGGGTPPPPPPAIAVPPSEARQ